MRSNVRATLLGLTALIAAWAPPAARAEDAFPSRVVRLVVPAASGSTTDTIARLLAEKLGRTWSQSVIVENISGGAMNTGAEHVAKAAPDGYTLMVTPPSPVSINHLLYSDLNYDPRKFTAVALLAKIPNALVVRNDLPAKDVQELIAFAKANPGKLSFGSQGAGSTAHLSASQLEVLAGIKMVHVPYRGALPALNDVIAGHIDMFFDTLTTSVPQWRAGKVRILAVAGPERNASVPELPTVAEAALPGFEVNNWVGFFAPARTPPDIVQRWNGETLRIMQSPEIQARLPNEGARFIPMTPEQFGAFVKSEIAKWAPVVKASGARVD